MTETETKYCIDFNDVKAAASRIQGTAHRTPVLTSSSIDDLAKRNLFFKVEALQRTGSFKFRGALNAVRSVLSHPPSLIIAKDNDDESKGVLSVVTHSSGNHAQALALAAKLSSTEKTTVEATIVMPYSTPLVKKAAVEAFGGIIVMAESTPEAREEAADRILTEKGGGKCTLAFFSSSSECSRFDSSCGCFWFSHHFRCFFFPTKLVFIHPSEDPRVIAGQGTVCLEFVEQVKELGIKQLDVVIIPVGGGGLASGNIVTLRALLGDKVKIVLAEPSVLDDAKRSFEAGELLKHAPDNKLDSVADGLKTTLGPNTFPVVCDKVNDIITVTEEEILKATKLIWERLKIAIEPSAGVGVAVALSTAFATKYPAQAFQNVGVILCGGNVDILKIAKKMEENGL